MENFLIFLILFSITFSAPVYEWTPREVKNEIAGFNSYTYTLYDLDNLISDTYQNKYDSELKKLSKYRHIFPVLVIIDGIKSGYTISDILSNIVHSTYYLENNIIMVYSMYLNTFDSYSGFNIDFDYSSLRSSKINKIFNEAKQTNSDKEKLLLTVLEEMNKKLKTNKILIIVFLLIFIIIIFVIIYFLVKDIRKRNNQNYSGEQYVPVQEYPNQQVQYGTFQQQPQQVVYPNQGNYNQNYNQGNYNQEKL
jgi:cell division protein FtsL